MRMRSVPGLDRFAVDQHLTGSRRLQTSDQVQQSGLAATRRTNDAEELTGLHLQVDVVERQQASRSASGS